MMVLGAAAAGLPSALRAQVVLGALEGAMALARQIDAAPPRARPHALPEVLSATDRKADHDALAHPRRAHSTVVPKFSPGRGSRTQRQRAAELEAWVIHADRL